MTTLLTSTLSFNTNFIREAEFKHGRTAMVAIPTIAFLETVNPSTLGIDQLESTPLEYQLLGLGIFGCSEVAQLFNSYEFPNSTENWFKLKDSHEPGDYAFNPLNLTANKDLELGVGRMAMIGTLGLMVQELGTHTNVF